MTQPAPASTHPARSEPFPVCRLTGVRFHVCDYDAVLDWLRHSPPGARSVCVSNVADVRDAHKRPAYATALEDGDLVVPDGMPIVWSMRSEGHDIRDRVYGPTLMDKALRNPDIAARRHVLLGGSAQARDGVRQKFSHAHFVGEQDFFYDQLDEDAFARYAAELNALQPDFIWVCLGGGRQVLYMHRVKPLLSQGTLLGVGAAFDFHAGLLKQAPKLLQDAGLEGVFRLVMEPRRLFHRYVIHNPPYFYLRWKEKRARKP